ncbi:ly6/PLAUR domain-containing protein 6B [Bombina bombina]|uniref:ly6/PLAUR domain-containing protein 6B n=1 Tax=Bombina bombina TaxID=8345 RepID=UPI00235A56C8|nr:ly6/PLAUR domain-containing protein 6B [Bombina bombina]XP_053554264.1 ly6/PLAUR domain-containing protein 6B [Bombina bombina]XP_053554265.1 ly6/PLAUR domain-containing protein 6B [Bombina bombina]
MLTSHFLILCYFHLLVLLKHKTWAKNINFHNVRPPLDPTPFPNSFKCFTCETAIDNYNCNRWAEDKWCPQNTHFCKTVHHFTSLGRSKFVTKKCATKEECRSVGCHHHKDYGHTECISCCDGMICNVDVPTNHTNAVFNVMRSHRTSGASRTAAHIYVVTTVILLLIVP